MSEQTDHYFTAEPASAAERRTLDVTLAGHRVSVQTAPGVFCPDRLDVGTAVLLEHVPAPPATGAVLDLGCGWGPIALALGLLSPRRLGVGGGRQPAGAGPRPAQRRGRSGWPDFHACTPEEVPEDLRFAAIWSNPPIRVGKAVLHDMLLTWLPRLADGGAAYLVVQKNLGSDSLQRWLDAELAGRFPGQFSVARHASARTFRVLSVVRAVHDHR